MATPAARYSRFIERHWPATLALGIAVESVPSIGMQGHVLCRSGCHFEHKYQRIPDSRAEQTRQSKRSPLRPGNEIDNVGKDRSKKLQGRSERCYQRLVIQLRVDLKFNRMPKLHQAFGQG